LKRKINVLKIVRQRVPGCRKGVGTSTTTTTTTATTNTTAAVHTTTTTTTTTTTPFVVATTTALATCNGVHTHSGIVILRPPHSHVRSNGAL